MRSARCLHSGGRTGLREPAGALRDGDPGTRGHAVGTLGSERGCWSPCNGRPLGPTHDLDTPWALCLSRFLCGWGGVMPARLQAPRRAPPRGAHAFLSFCLV